MTPIYPRRAKGQFVPVNLPARALALRMGLSAGVCLALMLLMGHTSRAWASDAPAAKPAPVSKAAASAAPAPMTAKEVGDQVREAVESGGDAKKKNLTLMVNGKDKKFITLPAGEKPAAHGPAKVADAGHGAAPAQAAAHAAAPAMAAPRAMHVADHAEPAVPGRIANPQASRQYIRARAAALTGHEAPSAGASAGADAHAGEAHWSYDGATGPQAWGSMKPDFNVCAIGKRQSPINIEESATLRGPAEPITFNYTPSDGTVVNNGHTIQVDVLGDNSITVRGTSYKLLQFHFHHPSEERVNYKGFSMVAHLVHKSAEGQLAVVAVLLEPGAVNTLINKVWTYMPLDSGDRVRMPTSLLEMTELLPADQRYYQFMGSLTTPPCSEGVLWMVLKTPMTVSREQIRLFAQLFPNNARPVQAVNGRAVRNAQ